MQNTREDQILQPLSIVVASEAVGTVEANATGRVVAEEGTGVHEAPPDVGESINPAPSVRSPGSRLRDAREALGLGREEFARKARIPLAVLGDLESDAWSRLGAAVYVRGYVRSYSRAAGIDQASIVDSLAAVADATPPLVAARALPSRPQWVSRYATPVAYALLTGVVMIPLVYLARPSATQLASAPSLSPLDAPPTMSSSVQSGGLTSVRLSSQITNLMSDSSSSEPLNPATPERTAAATAEGIEVTQKHAAPLPVMASMTSLPEAPGQQVRLHLRELSWVEFTAADGKRLEYALLPAGTIREYRVAGSARLRIGNSRGVGLEIDRKPVDLLRYSRGNIAELNVGRASEQGAN